MAFQSTLEFKSCRNVSKALFERHLPTEPSDHHPPKLSYDRGLAPSDRNLSALEEELALMDAAIPLTLIPDWSENADQDMSIWNILQEDKASSDAVKPRRVARRSRARRGRLVALRRRATRVLLRKSASARRVWRASSKTELQALRSCIYEQPKSDPALSLPLRMTTHAMSLALIATALPAGIALLAYNLLKGEDMRVTARMTTLSGMALVVIGGNLWLASIAGI